MDYQARREAWGEQHTASQFFRNAQMKSVWLFTLKIILFLHKLVAGMISGEPDPTHQNNLV
jgi:hypothetical protein